MGYNPLKMSVVCKYIIIIVIVIIIIIIIIRVLYASTLVNIKLKPRQIWHVIDFQTENISKQKQKLFPHAGST